MFDKSKSHLIPPAVEGSAQVALDDKKNINERSNHIVRLEAIRSYCESVIEQFNRMIKRR